MLRFGVGCGLVLLACWLLALPANAQQSRCADCHFSQPDAPEPEHLSDWDRSAHSRNNVGCEKCHGGDPATFEPFIAHRGILNSANPASPVNRRNLSATCGTCHPGAFTAFQNSKHFSLLQKADHRVPVCSTCHGAAGFRRLSARGLEAQCRQCHGPNGVAPTPGRAEAARALYEALDESRDVMKSARVMVNRVNDKARRARLDQAYEQAQVPLTEAVQAGHQFVFDQLKERLSVAQQRIETLLAELADPKP